MSTYVNPMTPQKMDFSDCPPSVRDFLKYELTIKGLSPRTVNAYYIDLRTFFRYLYLHRNHLDLDTPLDKIDLSEIDIEFIRKIDKAEIYNFLFHATQERDNAAVTRARKLSSMRGFFKYLTSKMGLLDKNPMDDVEMPIRKKRLPKYLTLDESLELLNNIQSDYPERDYCVLTLFLNCGMRLSELVALNITDRKDDTLRVVGKGNKERIIYLNNACSASLDTLLESRASLSRLKDKKALFVSKRTGERLSARRVQQIVNDCLKSAGLDGKGYSVHKLRHTAATLMYQHGNVDLLSLKEMLGHADVSTTEIYTHLDSAQLKEAADSSPLANVAPQADKKAKPPTDE